MYELGLCHALWKKVVLLSQIRDDVPFDLRAWRVLWYDFTFAGAARLKDELRRAIAAVRGETAAPEATIVPLKLEKEPPPPPPLQADAGTEWMFGTIVRWGSSHDYGFIQVEGEDFYFNEDYLFSKTSEPREGDRVVFKGLAPVAVGKSRRASQIFVHGEELTGTVEKIFP